MINKAGSSFYMNSNVVGSLRHIVRTIIGFTRGEFPFTYLGSPIFYTRRRKDYYNNLIKKVKASYILGRGSCSLMGEKLH